MPRGQAEKGEKTKKGGERWTRDERRRLYTRHYHGVSYKEIGEELNRTALACRKVVFENKQEREEYCQDLEAALGLAALQGAVFAPRPQRAEVDAASANTASSASGSSATVGSDALAGHGAESTPRPQRAEVDAASTTTASSVSGLSATVGSGSLADLRADSTPHPQNTNADDASAEPASSTNAQPVLPPIVPGLTGSHGTYTNFERCNSRMIRLWARHTGPGLPSLDQVCAANGVETADEWALSMGLSVIEMPDVA